MTTDTDHDTRTDRILDVAIELAGRDGYDAVRMRDLAALADVALGTVYRRFGSKEDILAAALQRMVEQFYEAVTLAPVPGITPFERLCAFFTIATQSLAEQPKLAAALFRAVASGDAEVAHRVLRYRDTMTDILLLVRNGAVETVERTAADLWFARVLQNLWFAEMVGWTGGLQSADEAIEQMHAAVAWLLHQDARTP